jgi:DNA-binding IclR family transcriptional regulator
LRESAHPQQGIFVAETEKNDRNSIQVIARAAEILRLLPDHGDGLTLGEIAKHTKLARSTVQRIVKALSDEQFLIPASQRGGVKLGPGLVPLAAAAQVDIAELVKPLMQDLSRTVNETVDLSILSGSEVLYIAQVTGNNRLAALSGVGETHPVYSTASGKALLSCFPVDKQRQLVMATLTKDTAHTLETVDEVLEQVRVSAADGIFIDCEEHTDGICAIGTAFLDAVGRPHALSCPVPHARFERLRPKLRSNLLACRDRIVGAVKGTLP